MVGSDALWLSALGDAIRREGQVPTGRSVRRRSDGHWVNTTALGQVVFSAFYRGRLIGIVVAQLVAVVVALGVLARPR